MSEPRIFRRCALCGTSFRVGSLFCPQCGVATTGHNTRQLSSAENTTSGLANSDDAANGNPSIASDEQESQAGGFVTRKIAPPAMGGISSSSNVSATAASNVSLQQATDHRATQGPGHGPGTLERRLRPRVDKLRKGTSLVIDEATYDPSLRFVLIAGLLFLLFLVLLFLSKWIG